MQLPTILLLLFAFTSCAQAESRRALLIGNQAPSEKVGRLKNPHDDIALVGAALEKISVKCWLRGDRCRSQAACPRGVRAWEGYYQLRLLSWPRASDPETQINYVIPVDVASTESCGPILRSRYCCNCS